MEKTPQCYNEIKKPSAYRVNQQKNEYCGQFQYLVDEFASEGGLFCLCDNIAQRVVGTTTELIRGKI